MRWDCRGRSTTFPVAVGALSGPVSHPLAVCASDHAPARDGPCSYAAMRCQHNRVRADWHVRWHLRTPMILWHVRWHMRTPMMLNVSLQRVLSILR